MPKLAMFESGDTNRLNFSRGPQNSQPPRSGPFGSFFRAQKTHSPTGGLRKIPRWWLFGEDEPIFASYFLEGVG